MTLSLYHVIGRGLREALPLSAYVFGVWATAAATLAVLAAVARSPVFGYPLRTFGLFLALALVPTVIGHGLVNRSLRRIPAPTVGLFLLGEPIAAVRPGLPRLRGGTRPAHHRGRRAGAGRARHRRARASRRDGARAAGARPVHGRHDLDARRSRHGRGRARHVGRGDRGPRPRPAEGGAPHPGGLRAAARAPRDAALDVAAARARGGAAGRPRRRRRRPHPRHGHPRGDGLPARPHARERQAGRLLRRHAHGVGPGLGRPRQPHDRGAHGRPSRMRAGAACSSRWASRSSPPPRRPSGTRRASAPSAARAARWPSWTAGQVVFQRPAFRVPPLRARRLVSEVDLHAMAAGVDDALLRASLARGARGLVVAATGCRERAARRSCPACAPPSPPASPWCSSRAARRAAWPPPTATKVAGRCCATWGSSSARTCPGPKARIKLMVALGTTSDVAEIRRIFE